MSAAYVARRLFDIRDVIEGRELVSWNIGPDLRPILMSLAGKADYRWIDRIDASFPKLFASRSNRFRLHYLADGGWASVDLAATHENYHAIQPLPSGRWLAVRARATSINDNNAHVFDAEGRHVTSFHVGDGIADCQATIDGQIWVSYFDEGVYGDVPTGQSGLVTFDSKGETLGTYADAGDQVGGISDCYAMNVTSASDVWLCYYTDFPIAHLHRGKLQNYWSDNPVSGSHTFAIGNGFIVFAGSYDHHDVLLRLQLADMQMETLSIVDEDLRSILGYLAIGRGNKLFLQAQDIVYEVDVTASEVSRI